MAEVKFFCPGCRAKLAIDAKAAGFAVHCPHCGKRMKIPDLPNQQRSPQKDRTTLDETTAKDRPWQKAILNQEEIDFLTTDEKRPPAEP